jgi:hypothetical protein
MRVLDTLLAEGNMQFEPTTFAVYTVHADRSARLGAYDLGDAIFTAAGCCALTALRAVRPADCTARSSPITTRTGTSRMSWPSRPGTQRPKLLPQRQVLIRAGGDFADMQLSKSTAPTGGERRDGHRRGR